MSLEEAKIERIYKCTECKCELRYVQLAKEDFMHECPLCFDPDGLVIKSGKLLNISTFVDMNTPKTLGGLAEQNSKHKEKEEGKEAILSEKQKKKKPFWRKTAKPNFDILKNPSRYVESGRI